MKNRQPAFLLPYDALAFFLERLHAQMELHGPLRCQDGAVRFGRLQKGDLPDLQAVRTLLSPKKYLLAPCETILTYHSENGYQSPPQSTNPLTLLGVHPCDLAAIAYLDRQFLGDPPDPIYAAHRERMTLVGCSCTPDNHCSCYSSPSLLPARCDLFMQQTEKGYLISVESHRGEAMYPLIADLLVAADQVQPQSTSRANFGVAVATPLEEELDTTLADWQELADHCLGCGACSISCPTCACFEILEFGGLDGDSAERLRRWDNCLFRSHAQVAGGHSFQKDRAQRFRYRYRHKYRGYGPLQGVPACVGCGRCRVQCPADLDLRPLAERLEKGLS